MMNTTSASTWSMATPRIPLLHHLLLGLASSVMAPDADDEWPMVERRGAHLMAAGHPYHYPRLQHLLARDLRHRHATRPRVTTAIAEAADAGLNVCRTWAFNDGGYRALQTAPFCYDEEVFQALDFVVSEARRHKMRLIMSLCNNWEDYGGKAQYVRWAKEAGLDLTSDDEFFSDPTIKSYYKAFLRLS